MKNFVLLIITALSLLNWALAHADSLTLRNGTTWANCDQVFAPEPLRYGYAYRFYDRFNNASSQTAYIWNQNFAIEAGNFLSKGQPHPTGNLLDFSAVLAANNYAVASGTSMEVVNTYTADWGVINKPVARSTGAGDIGFKYTIGYDLNNSGNPSGIKSHVECQPYIITWCGDGVLDSGFEQCDGTAGVGAGQTCNASCQIVNNTAPTCNGLTATPIFSVAPTSVAISCATSNATTVAIDCGNGQTINAANGTCNYAAGWFYTATCTVNGTITNAACSAGVQVDNARFDLSLKKFVNGQDAQTPATAVTVVGGSTVAYTFVVTNNGPVPVTNVTTVTDSTLGGNLVLQWVPSGSGWNCTIEGTGFRCTRIDALAVGASFPPITAQVVVTNTAGTYINIASVANPSENPINNFGNNNTDPANVIVGSVAPGLFDLSLKKYINSIAQDAQDGAPVNIAPTTAFTYLIRVTNTALSANAVTGTTTVTDPGPAAGVNLIGTPSGTGWTCTRVGAGFSCTTTATPAIGANFPDILASATTTAATGTFRNLATVANPGDTTLTNNTDPANVQVGTGGGGGGGPGSCESLTAVQVSGTNTVGYAMQCTPSIAAGGSPTIEIRCGNGQIINGATGTCLFNSSAGSPYQAECYVNNSTSGGPNTGCRRQLDVTSGAPLPPGVYCGNGIIDQGLRTLIVPAPLGAGWTCNANMNPAAPTTIRDYTCTSTLSEQCDAGNVGGVNISNALCNAVCQTTLCVPGTPGCATSTNPSGNPLSILFDPSAPGRTTQSVSATRWIIGNGVPVFDAGDQFLLSSPFPTILRGATMAISNSSALIDGTSANKTFGPECIGAGSIDFGAGPQPCNNNTPVFTAGVGGMINGVTFKGNASTIAAAGTFADVNPPLSAGSAILQSNFAISLGYLVEPIPVRVSKPAVSTTAGGGAFVAAARPVGFDVNTITSGFLNDLQRGNFTISAGTNTNSATLGGSNSSVGLSPSGVVTPSSVVTITTAADTNHTNFAKVGDAPNIYLIANGAVKLGSPTTPLILSGIGTIVIEKGTLEILGDIQYADANSSWAFIIKEPAADGVAIRIAPGVERIAGAYLALSGKATGTSSTTPLAIDGNMNADIGELVTSRTYIRGVENSTALSTGVTINYSTRALKNPPPLLTQYLEQYNLDRVSR